MARFMRAIRIDAGSFVLATSRVSTFNDRQKPDDQFSYSTNLSERCRPKPKAETVALNFKFEVTMLTTPR
jgi:hypothetical protein